VKRASGQQLQAGNNKSQHALLARARPRDTAATTTTTTTDNNDVNTILSFYIFIYKT
jgi:hypothetical protein